MKGILLLLIISFFILSFSIKVNASVAIPEIYFWCDVNETLFEANFSCLNDDCTINSSKYDEGVYGKGIIVEYPSELKYRGKTYIRDRKTATLLYFESKRYNLISYSYCAGSEDGYEIERSFVETLNLVCVQKISNIESFFIFLEEKIVEWDKSGNLNLLPYTNDSEDIMLIQRLEKTKNDPNSCGYNDFEIIGNWLYVSDYKRIPCAADYFGWSPLIFLVLLAIIVIFVFFKNLLHFTKKTRAVLNVLLIIFIMLIILQGIFLVWLVFMAFGFFPSIILTLILGHFMSKNDSWKSDYKASMIFTYLTLQIVVIPIIFLILLFSLPATF